MRYVERNCLSDSTYLPQHQKLTNLSPLTGVLGCTGSVGQRFILLLQGHPTLELFAIGASSRSAGKKYKDAVRWKQASPIGDVADMVVRECRPEEFKDCDVVFSGLDSDVAGDVGELKLDSCCLSRITVN